MTIWKAVPDFPDYHVSEHGELRRSGRYLRAERVSGNGRKRFALSRGQRIYRFKAAQIVAMAFIGPPPFEGAEVCHNDSFLHNNHYSNLRWGAHAANAADVTAHKAKLRSHSSLPQRAGELLAVDAAAFIAKASEK